MRFMIVAMLALPGVAAAELQIVSPAPTGVHLRGVWGSGTDVYLVGDLGTILKTSDGTRWQRLDAKTTENLYAVWGSGRELYIAADANTILSSGDGGATWTAAHPPTNVTTALYAVWGTGPDDVYVAGVNGALVHTADRGKTWVSLNPSGTFGYSTLTGIAGTTKGADVYVVTGSGGLLQRATGTWYAGGASGDGLRAITAVPNGYLAVGDAGRLLAYDATGHPRDLARPATRILRAVSAHGATVVAVGETGWSKPAQATRATLLRSSDGGATWAAVDSGVDHHLSAVWGTGATWWAVGEAGTIARSTDGGAHWTSLGKRALADGAVRAFASAGTSIVAGGTGLARSTDGGATWTSVRRSAGAVVAAIPGGFLAVEEAGATPIATRSTDGGATWSPIAVTGSQPMPRLEALAAGGSTIVGVGDAGTVARSSDRGATWVTTKLGAAHLRAVWTIGNNWYVAGDDEALYRSTDDGATWSSMRGPGRGYQLRAGWAGAQKTVTLVIAAVSVPPAISRGSQPPSHGVVLRSVDGGKTWSETEMRDHYALTAIAASGATLVIAGDHGSVLRSTDSGKTWSAVRVPLQGTPGAVWTDGTTILVGGDRGEIVRGR